MKLRLLRLCLLVGVALAGVSTTFAAPGENDVKSFVYRWFSLFDRNAPVEAFLPYLDPHGLVMKLPETELHSRDDFRTWYAGIRQRRRPAASSRCAYGNTGSS